MDYKDREEATGYLPGSIAYCTVMRTVIGVDAELHCVSALRLLERLSFANEERHLVHVQRDVFLEIGVLDLPLAQLSIAEANKRAGLEALATVQTEYPTPAVSHLIEGHPAAQLMEFGDTFHADLIAAATTHRGFGAFITGSICRALTIAAKQSVLVAKGPVEKEGPIRAVFATDHSAYANRCLKTLLSLSPCGLSEVTVLSVMEPITCAPFSVEATEALDEINQHEERSIEVKTKSVCSQFEMFGATANSQVVVGETNTVISDFMRETESDLLIIGAQGHGFIERLAAGSVAVHQVIGEQYPVLIVRAK